ncbi:MAG: hypothetical protein WCT19_03575 [Candidatus Paceibacterota bacterium]
MTESELEEAIRKVESEGVEQDRWDVAPQNEQDNATYAWLDQTKREFDKPMVGTLMLIGPRDEQ